MGSITETDHRPFHLCSVEVNSTALQAAPTIPKRSRWEQDGATTTAPAEMRAKVVRGLEPGSKS
jgi:hypothetical protein